MNTEQKQPTFKDHIMVLEKAIDIATSKGCYNKLEVVQLVQSLSYIYQLEIKHSEGTEFKGIIPKNEKV